MREMRISGTIGFEITAEGFKAALARIVEDGSGRFGSQSTVPAVARPRGWQCTTRSNNTPASSPTRLSIQLHLPRSCRARTSGRWGIGFGGREHVVGRSQE